MPPPPAPRPSREITPGIRHLLDSMPGVPAYVVDAAYTEMLALSPRFAQMWAEHEVEVRGPMLKHVAHPQAGPFNAHETPLLVKGCTESAWAWDRGRAAGTYGAAGMLIMCGAARRVAPSGGRTTRIPEDNEHGL